MTPCLGLTWTITDLVVLRRYRGTDHMYNRTPLQAAEYGGTGEGGGGGVAKWRGGCMGEHC